MPATATCAGYSAVEVPSGPDGTVDMAALDRLMTDRVAAIMLTVMGFNFLGDGLRDAAGPYVR